MADTVIRGDAFIKDNSSLVQLITTYPEDETKPTIVEEKVLIINIWDDLLSVNGTYLQDDGERFYWEYKKDNDDGDEVTAQVDCPKYNGMDLGKSESTWAQFWSEKLNEKFYIQPDTIHLVEQKYLTSFAYDSAGEMYIGNPGGIDVLIDPGCGGSLGDIENLLYNLD